jgi:hypothetical protein
MISDEKIIAYVDGELDAAGVAEIETAMAADPELAERVARQADLRAATRHAFAGVLQEAVPERLLRAAGALPEGAEVIRPDFQNAAKPTRGKRAAPFYWMAIAASLVVGVLVGRALDPAPFAAGPGGLQARGDLASALDHKPSAEAGVVRIGLSFRNGERAYCRTFQMDREALAGLACREGDRWMVRMTAASKGGPGGGDGYRMAASAIPAAVLSSVDETIVGEPLDAAQEREALAAGWR